MFKRSDWDMLGFVCISPEAGKGRSMQPAQDPEVGRLLAGASRHVLCATLPKNCSQVKVNRFHGLLRVQMKRACMRMPAPTFTTILPGGRSGDHQEGCPAEQQGLHDAVS